MKQPKPTDSTVKVTAYMTDETFGYEHWRAAQFCAPDATIRRPAILILCADDAEREAIFTELERLPSQRKA